MAGARRAAQGDENAEASVAELGTVTSARRGAGPRAGITRGRAVRFAMAPLAILSVVGLAAGLMIVPPTTADETDPGTAATAPLGVSRDLARPALTPTQSPSPTATPTPTVTPSSIPSVTPTPSASPSATATPTPTPTPSASPTAKAAPTKSVDYTSLGDTAGSRYATDSVNVRTGPGKDFDSRTTLSEGDKVTITEREVDGWRQVVVSKKSGWVKESFLTSKQPAPAPTSSKSSSSSDGGDSGSDDAISTGASCPKAGSLESHLTSRTAKVLRAVCAKFDGVSSYGGYRPGAGSYHGSGRAIDIMVSGDYGWQIAKWARANASELGVIEVIYQQKIWTTQRSGDGWRSMSDRGSATANHYDHVHLSVR